MKLFQKIIKEQYNLPIILLLFYLLFVIIYFAIHPRMVVCHSSSWRGANGGMPRAKTTQAF